MQKSYGFRTWVWVNYRIENTNTNTFFKCLAKLILPKSLSVEEQIYKSGCLWSCNVFTALRAEKCPSISIYLISLLKLESSTTDKMYAFLTSKHQIYLYTQHKGALLTELVLFLGDNKAANTDCVCMNILSYHPTFLSLLILSKQICVCCLKLINRDSYMDTKRTPPLPPCIEKSD